MFKRLIKISALALTLALPTGLLAGGCVDSFDNTVTFVQNGRTYSAQRITSFSADLTQRDLYNSRGIRLTTAGAVLQQYVANRVKAGQYVTENGYFRTLERRTQLSTAPLYGYCGDPEYFRQVLTNTVNARIQASTLWVLGFRQPNGRIAFFLSPAG